MHPIVCGASIVEKWIFSFKFATDLGKGVQILHWKDDMEDGRFIFAMSA